MAREVARVHCDSISDGVAGLEQGLEGSVHFDY